MFADDESLYVFRDISFKKRVVSSFNSHLQHKQWLHCIYSQSHIILIDMKIGFSFKNKEISLQ